MNGAHAHLLLNHVPVLGVPFALLLLGAGILRRSLELQKAALVALLLAALLAVAAYLTGEPAEDALHGVPGVSGPAIEAHEEAALTALAAALAAGAVAGVALVAARRGRTLPGWLLLLTLAAALTGSILLAWTSNLGGRVHHPELREGFSPPE